MDKSKQLKALNAKLDDLCSSTASELSANVVHGEGDPDSLVVFVGEAPGKEEDVQRRPFVGPVGGILTSAIEAAGWRRSDAYITNVVKCRPPNNRQPRKSEVQLFLPYLKQELEIVKPRVVCLLGATALKSLTGKTLAEACGKAFEMDGSRYFCTYHPAALIYNVSLKKLFIDHIRLLRKTAESPEP